MYQVNGGEGRSPDPISGKATSVMWETLAEHVHTVVGKWGHITLVGSKCTGDRRHIVGGASKWEQVQEGGQVNAFLPVCMNENHRSRLLHRNCTGVTNTCVVIQSIARTFLPGQTGQVWSFVIRIERRYAPEKS